VPATADGGPGEAQVPGGAAPQSRAWWSLAGITAVAAGANLLVNRLAPAWAFVPIMALAGVAAVALARLGGATTADLGLVPGPARRSALAGLAFGGVAATFIFAGLAVPALRDLYVDQRAAGIGVGGLLYYALVRIPLGTALGEELLFRSAALGAGLRLGSSRLAIGLSSLLFGLWHILPILSVRAGNAAMSPRSTLLIVVGGVAATGLAGAGFAWLRLRTGHVASTLVFHAVMNGSAIVAAYLAINA